MQLELLPIDLQCDIRSPLIPPRHLTQILFQLSLALLLLLLLRRWLRSRAGGRR